MKRKDKKMKVTIRGNNPITGENVKKVIDELNEEFKERGLKVKNLTCYIRFIDENGRTVEPTINGCEIEKEVTFKLINNRC